MRTRFSCESKSDGRVVTMVRSRRQHGDKVTTIGDITTTIDRRHDDGMTTTLRRCDKGRMRVISWGLTCHKPRFGGEPMLTGLDANPGLWRSSCRRHLAVMPPSFCRHAVSLLSSCRRSIVVVPDGYRARRHNRRRGVVAIVMSTRHFFKGIYMSFELC